MAKTISGAQAIIGVAAQSTMGCMLITKLAIMTLGDLVWMNVAKNGNRNDGQLKETKETPSKPAEGPSQKLALNDKLCNAFCTQAGLPLKQSIKSGRMPREMSRSESRVE